MKFLLSKLEGLDATPDWMMGWTRVARALGSFIYVDDDAHDQFKAAYGDKLQAGGGC